MINLIPPQIKEDTMYAKRNATLLRWSGVMVVVLIGLSAILVFGTVYIGNTAKLLEKDLEVSTQVIEDQKLNDVQKQTEEISNNLKLMLQVFSKRVLFSSLIRQIGASLPSGSQIRSLSLSDNDTTLQLDVEALDFSTATQVAVNLQDPIAKLFSKVDVESLDCNNASSDVLKCNTRIRGLLINDGQYRFINSLGTATP